MLYKRLWQTRTHCCGHIVADTNVSSFARTRNICCGHKFCVLDTKMFLILFRNILCPQQMFPSLRAQKKRHEHQCFRNNVSSFATALILFRNILCPQQMFPSLRSMETQYSFCVPRVCAPKKDHEQQCVRNNVSPFARTFKS